MIGLRKASLFRNEAVTTFKFYSNPNMEAILTMALMVSHLTLAVYQGANRCSPPGIWGAAEADVIREGMTPQAVAEKALARMGAILAKYPIAAS